MKIHCIIHAPFEKPGVIESWSAQNGHSFTEIHTYKNDVLPTVDAFDFLIVMGGPQSPHDINLYPYLEKEISLIKSAIAKNKKIFGVCLGAQLIAEALGAKTEKSMDKEVGMYPIEILKAAESDPVFMQFPESFDVMHWHNDMPGLPEGSVLLAKSKGCPRQAFRYGDRIYGFQFHLEPTKALIQEMMTHCPDDLIKNTYVRTKEELLNSDFESINQKMFVLLDHIAAL